MTTKHTPTPLLESWIQDRSNWEYIDKCVNNHDKLIERVERLSSLLTGISKHPFMSLPGIAKEIQITEQVLAEAEDK